jgi:hypothetical protein
VVFQLNLVHSIHLSGDRMKKENEREKENKNDA